jgi:hypothetical protein
MTTKVEQNTRIKLESFAYEPITNETKRFHGYDGTLMRVVDHTRTLTTPFTSNLTIVYSGKEGEGMNQNYLTKSGEVFQFGEFTVTRQ